MRKNSGLQVVELALMAVLGLGVIEPVSAQDMMRHVDLQSPGFTLLELPRA